MFYNRPQPTPYYTFWEFAVRVLLLREGLALAFVFYGFLASVAGNVLLINYLLKNYQFN